MGARKKSKARGMEAGDKRGKKEKRRARKMMVRERKKIKGFKGRLKKEERKFKRAEVKVKGSNTLKRGMMTKLEKKEIGGKVLKFIKARGKMAV
jgi:hypothetical protein